MTIDTTFLNVGIYSIPQAARLVGVSDARLRSWMMGSTIRTKAGPKRQPPLWVPHIPEMNGRGALTFLDLMEIRLVKRLLDQEKGMGLRRIREALANFRMVSDGDHPLLNKKLFTDGAYLYNGALDENGKPLLNLNKWQFVFEAVVAPTLDAVDIGNDDLPYRWWPKGRDGFIVLDPTQSFGDPILEESRVPTASIAQAFDAEQSADRVARWYQISVEQVRAAMLFEGDLVARRIAA